MPYSLFANHSLKVTAQRISLLKVNILLTHIQINALGLSYTRICGQSINWRKEKDPPEMYVSNRPFK
jgi:hypothetical protein